MENTNEILSEDEMNILTLTDEFGNETDFEYLDVIEYNGTEYLILLTTEEQDNEIVIMEIEPVDEENENYLAVEDPCLPLWGRCRPALRREADEGHTPHFRSVPSAR